MARFNSQSHRSHLKHCPSRRPHLASDGRFPPHTAAISGGYRADILQRRPLCRQVVPRRLPSSVFVAQALRMYRSPVSSFALRDSAFRILFNTKTLSHEDTKANDRGYRYRCPFFALSLRPPLVSHDWPRITPRRACHPESCILNPLHIVCAIEHFMSRGKNVPVGNVLPQQCTACFSCTLSLRNSRNNKRKVVFIALPKG